MNFNSNKYYYDVYLHEGLLTQEQIDELKKLENDVPQILFKLWRFVVIEEVNDRYREYFKDLNPRGNAFLKNLNLDPSVFNTIQDEQKYHVRLLHIANFISKMGLEKLNSLIERGILKRPGEIFTTASKYYNNQKALKSTRRKLEKAVEESILKSVPPHDEIFDDFDLIPFYHHANIFQTKNYFLENEELNILQLLKDIIAFLPNNEIFGNISIEKKEDGRDIYYSIQRDLIITIEANGIPYSLRSPINQKKYHGEYNTTFNDHDRQWSFSQATDIFNKIYREIGSEFRLHIISDLPPEYSHKIGNDSQIAILVSKKMTDSLRQDGIGFLGFNSKNRVTPNTIYLEKDFSDFLDKIIEVGLLDLYSQKEIEHVRHLGKTTFLHAPERLLWLIDYFVAAICPRESDSYKNFVELVPHLSHGKVLLENFQEDFSKGELGFSLNGKSYFTSDLLKDRFDPYFVLLINKAMQEQNLGAFYYWGNEFDPHEQFSIIYSTPDIISKAYTLKYPRFLELSEETIQHWRM